jgi:hypothetical protein
MRQSQAASRPESLPRPDPMANSKRDPQRTTQIAIRMESTSGQRLVTQPCGASAHAQVTAAAASPTRCWPGLWISPAHTALPPSRAIRSTTVASGDLRMAYVGTVPMFEQAGVHRGRRHGVGARRLPARAHPARLPISAAAAPIDLLVVTPAGTQAFATARRRASHDSALLRQPG